MASTEFGRRHALEGVTTVTTEAIIVATRGITPVYESIDGALRLRSFVREAPAPADLAECPRVVDEHGDPLRALVLRSSPLAPGVHLQIRALALMHDLSGSPFLVGTPLADDDAPAPELELLRPQLERLVQGEAGYGQASWTWSSARDAAAYVHEAAARAARARSGRRAVSSWDTRVDTNAAGASAAEAQVRRLPARFQVFVREQLDPQERVSFFVHRPQSRPRRLFAQPTREALVVVTDQQILWLEDVRAIGSDLQSWGYDARTMPLERLVALRRDRGAQEQLHLRSDAAGDELVIDLPASASRLISDIEERLRGFIDRSRPLPRRIYATPEPPDTLVLPTGWPDAEPIARGQLDAITRERGAAPVLASFVVPARMRGEPRALFALYPSELLFLPVPGERAQPEAFALGDIAWIELRRSVFTSHLRIVGVQSRTWTSASRVPVVSLFRALRPLLANAHPMVREAG